jgi:hypothetical protein
MNMVIGNVIKRKKNDISSNLSTGASGSSIKFEEKQKWNWIPRTM